jgi:hypothetical protein
MYKQSHPDPAQREIIFQMTKSDGTPDTGLTFAAGDLKLRKPRAFGAAANSSPWVNVDDTQRAAVVELGFGAYVYTFTPPELDTPGPGFGFHAQKGTGQHWTNVDEIQRAVLGKVAAGTLTSVAFTTDLTESGANLRTDCLITFLTGALAGQTKKIGASASGASAMITLAATLAFTTAPAVGDIFEILSR